LESGKIQLHNAPNMKALEEKKRREEERVALNKQRASVSDKRKRTRSPRRKRKAKRTKVAPTKLEANEFRVKDWVIDATVAEDTSHDGSGMRVKMTINKVTPKPGKVPGAFVWKKNIRKYIASKISGWSQVNPTGLTIRNAADKIIHDFSEIEDDSTLTVKSGSSLQNKYLGGNLKGVGNLDPDMLSGEKYRCVGCGHKYQLRPTKKPCTTGYIACRVNARRRLIDRFIRASLYCQTS